MRDSLQAGYHERGVALVVALLFLLVVTILSVTAARNSSLSLRMSGNQQDLYTSQQSAEAALFAVFSLGKEAYDPNDPNDPVFNLKGLVVDDPLIRLGSANPIRTIREANHIHTRIIPWGETGFCPVGNEQSTGLVNSSNNDDNSSAPKCYYYQIETEHDNPSRSRTQMALTLAKMVL